MRRCSILFVALLGVLSLSAVELVRDGKPVAEIALPEKPVSSVRFAAEEFQKHIALITGATLPIVQESDARNLPDRVHVGSGALPAEQSPFAWRIQAQEHDLFLCGVDKEIKEKILQGDPDGWLRNSSGTLLAVYNFFDRELGVRYVRPGDDGMLFTPRKDVVISPMDREGKPKLMAADMMHPYRERFLRKGGLRYWKDHKAALKQLEDNVIWLLRHGMVDTCSFMSGHAFSHYWKRFGKTHPEYFSMLPDGPRRPLKGDHTGKYVTMCVSCPGLWKQIAEDYRAAGAPDFYSICENDAAGLCTCPDCRAWDPPEFNAESSPYWSGKVIPDKDTRMSIFKVDEGGGIAGFQCSLSDRYCKFNVAVLKELRKINPRVCVTAYAYATTTAPPLHAKQDPGIIINYVGTPFFPMTERRMAQTRREWDGWRKTGCSMMFRPNTTWSYNCMPLQYTRQLAGEYRRVLQDPLLRRVCFDSLRSEFANQGLMYYTLARLTCHPEMTLAQIADEFFANFGAAAPAVREYYRFWTDLCDGVTEKDVNRWNRELGHIPNVWNGVDYCTKFMLPEHFAKAKEILEKAAALAVTPREKHEVEYLALGLEHARITLEMVKARLLCNKDYSKANREEFLRQYREVRKFRAAHEKDRISNMGQLIDKEEYGFRRNADSKPVPIPKELKK